MNSIHPKIGHLDLNLLRVFEAVFEAQHLTRAAEMLALTPSAVSHALRRLREHMADPLFTRQGHAMVPTPVCQRLAPALFEHMERLHQLLQQWENFVPGETKRTFRIGMPEGVELTLLAALQKEFFQQAPYSSLTSTAFDRSNLARLLSAGQIDVAIDVAMPIGGPVLHHPLSSDSYCVVARSGHPLGHAPTLKQYLAARHITVSGRAMGAVLEDATFLRRGIQRQISLRCQNYTSALEIVANSDLLLTVPTHLSQHAAAQLCLQRWSPPFKLPNVPISLYWHVSNDSDFATQWLRSVVVRVAQTHWTDSAVPMIVPQQRGLD